MAKRRTKKTKRPTKDSLQNVASGLGVNKSKRSHNRWVYDLLNMFEELDACYQSNWIGRQIVDVPTRDMTREWRRIKSTGAEDIAALEQELTVPAVVEEALAWARLFGGSGILMMTGQDLSQPLNLNRVQRGSLLGLRVFDRWQLNGLELNTTNILADNYLQPEYYNVGQGAQLIHHSHVVRFMGERVPNRQLAQTQGWGDSVLRKCIEEVSDMVAAKNGIAELMQEANIDVLSREALNDDLASDQDQDIIARYELFSLMKSSINMALLDSTETLQRQTLNLSGVAPIIELFITWISGAARIPVTKLFGTSARGLNATGEGDMKNYYDDIRAMQVSAIGLPLRRLDEVLVRSALGRFPNDFDYEFNPLQQANIVEAAQADLLRSQKNQVYLDMGVITRSQIQRELQANEEYQFDEEDIRQLEELEDVSLTEQLPEVNPELLRPASALEPLNV